MGSAQGLNKVWERLFSFEICCSEKVCKRIQVGRLPEMSESKGNDKKRALKCLMHILFVCWGFNWCQHVLRELLGCGRWLAAIGLFREPVESQRDFSVAFELLNCCYYLIFLKYIHPLKENKVTYSSEHVKSISKMLICTALIFP